MELAQAGSSRLGSRSCRYFGPWVIPGSTRLELSSALALSWLQARACATLEPTSSDDLEDIHPQGSSRATGGILRGRAAASYYSPADEENIFYDSIGTAKLTAKIYTSDLDPLNLNRDNMVPSSKVTIKMNPNLGPILDNISQRYPAIKGIC